jgi:hypothetical protein
MLTIKDAETDRLARRLAALTGESLTKAVRHRQERLERQSASAAGRRSSTDGHRAPLCLPASRRRPLGR